MTRGWIDGKDGLCYAIEGFYNGNTEQVLPHLCRAFFRLSLSNASRHSDATLSKYFPRQTKKFLDKVTT